MKHLYAFTLGILGTMGVYTFAGSDHQDTVATYATDMSDGIRVADACNSTDVSPASAATNQSAEQKNFAGCGGVI